MVVIPEGTTNLVAPAPIQTALLSPGVLPDAHGASAFRSFSDAADVEVRKRDRRSALRASMDAQKAVDNIWFGQNGGRFKEGQEFFDWAEDAEQRVDDAIQLSTKGLTSSQLELAQGELDSMRQSFGRNVQQRMGPVRKTFYEGAFALDLEDIGESSATHAGDPTATVQTLQDGLDKGAFRIAEFATEFPEYLGVDRDLWLKTQAEQYDSMLVRKAITQATANGNDKLAEQYLEHFGHLMTADQKIAAEKDVELSTDLGDIANTFEITSQAEPLIVAGNGRELAAAAGREYRAPEAQIAEWKRIQRQHGKEQGWSQKKIEEAVAYTDARGKEMLRVERAKQADVFEAMHTELANGGNLLTLQKERPTAWHHLSGKQQDSLLERANDSASGKLNSKDAEAWFTLRYLAFGTPEDQQAFLEEMESRTPLSSLTDAHWKAAQGWAEDIRAGREDKLAGVRSETDRIKGAINASGLNDKDAERFFNVADEIIAAEKVRRDLDQLPAQDITAILERLQVDELFDAQGRPVILDDPLYETTVEDMEAPPAWWMTNVGAPILSTSGQEHSLYNFKALYLDELRRKGTLTAEGRIPPEDRARAIREGGGDADDGVPLPYGGGGTGSVDSRADDLDDASDLDTRDGRLASLEAAGIEGDFARNLAGTEDDSFLGRLQTQIAIGISEGQIETNKEVGKNIAPLLQLLGVLPEGAELNEDLFDQFTPEQIAAIRAIR